MSIEAAFDAALRPLYRDEWFGRLLVAVSGGGDSIALLHLARDWAGRMGVDVEAVTVDHGLRAESAAEAEAVGRTCAGLDVPHRILRWQGWDGQGNLPQEARAARYDLIAGATGPEDLPTLNLIGHTRDDIAETFLLRLARGSGVDGLAAMRADWRDRGQRWARPLLAVGRGELRDWLRLRGMSWIDDPSNDDPRYDRARARQALAALAPLGLGVDRLADTAAAMSRARAALAEASHTAARAIAWTEAGDVVFDRAGLEALLPELRDRLLTHALGWVSGNPLRPRRTSLIETEAALAAGAPRATLHGCLITAGPKTLRLSREPAATGPEVPTTALWDGRWRVNGPHLPASVIRPLGEAGLAICRGWRESSLPRASLIASPAIWDARDDSLIAAPLARPEPLWSAEIAHPRGDFFTALLTH